MTIGSRLRTLRKAQRLTLAQLAKASGVALATISRIETGKMTGTLESHLELARALGLTLPEFYAGLEENGGRKHASVQTKSLRTEVYAHAAGRATLRMLTQDVLQKKMMPVLVEIAPGGRTQPEQAPRGTEKFLYVMDGAVEVTVGEERFALKREETLYLDASAKHALRNTGARPTCLLSVTTPPVL